MNNIQDTYVHMLYGEWGTLGGGHNAAYTLWSSYIPMVQDPPPP